MVKIISDLKERAFPYAFEFNISILIMFLFKKNNLQKTKSKVRFHADADIGLVIINAFKFKKQHSSSQALPDELSKPSIPHSRVDGNHLSLGIMSRKSPMSFVPPEQSHRNSIA